MSPLPKVLLSVDWDFFFPEKAEWDFGHSESHHPMLEDVLWVSRAAGLLSLGKDLRVESAPHESAAPSEFWAQLQAAGYEFSGARVGVAESHKAAAQFFLTQMSAAPMRIVHIDAHHDLGYAGAASLNQHVRLQRVDAGNWLGVLLRLLRDAKVDLVYPAWKDADAFGLSGAPMQKHVKARVTTAQWPVFPASPVQVAAVFVCRSGAWVPPWHDAAFTEFVSEVETLAGSEAEPCDEVRERPWDWAPVEAQAAVLRSMREDFKRRVG